LIAFLTAERFERVGTMLAIPVLRRCMGLGAGSELLRSLICEWGLLLGYGLTLRFSPFHMSSSSSLPFSHRFPSASHTPDSESPTLIPSPNLNYCF